MRLQVKKGKDYYAIVGILTYICSLILRVPLLYIIGEKGIGYFSVANELYIVLGCFLAYGLSEAVAVLVRYRMRRELFRSADRVMKGALVLALVLGGVLSVVLVFGSYGFVESIVQLPLSGLALSLMAPAIVFYVLTGVYKGYFQGNGSKIPAIHSLILETIIMAAGGLIGAGILHMYGKKVAALLQNEDYAAAYGARGAVIGLLSSAIFCFCHMFLLNFLYRGRTRRQAGARELQKNQDKGLQIVHMLLGTAIPYGIYMLLLRILPLLDSCLFFRFGGEGNGLAIWGKYYGKYTVIIGVVSAMLMLPYVGQIRGLASSVERGDYDIGRERLAVLMHQTALYTVAAAVFTAVLAENILNLLFKGNNNETAGWVMWGSVLIVLSVFSTLFMTILIRLRKMKTVLGILAAALVLHVAMAVLLLQTTGLGIHSLIVANVIFYVSVMAGGFLILSRVCRYRQEWLKAVAFTVVAAGIAGLIIMVLNRLLSPLIGSTISLVICLPIGIAVYLVLLILVRGVGIEELQDMTGGAFMIKIGELLHFM